MESLTGQVSVSRSTVVPRRQSRIDSVSGRPRVAAFGRRASAPILDWIHDVPTLGTRCEYGGFTRCSFVFDEYVTSRDLDGAVRAVTERGWALSRRGRSSQSLSEARLSSLHRVAFSLPPLFDERSAEDRWTTNRSESEKQCDAPQPPVKDTYFAGLSHRRPLSGPFARLYACFLTGSHDPSFSHPDNTT